MISQDRAIGIAKENYESKFEFYQITHGIPNNYNIYHSGDWSPDAVWCILYSAYPGQVMLVSSRAIVISKDTGEILFDGSTNDEG